MAEESGLFDRAEKLLRDFGRLRKHVGTLGERESGTARLEAAVAVFDAALTVFVPARADYYAGRCRAKRDKALALLSERKR